MYASLWRVLPGPWFVKLVLFLILIAAVVYALVTWVFPWVDLMLNPQDVTVE
jgi:hypothetical protein